MALVGAFLPWWGFDLSGINSSQAHRWFIWNPPRFNTQVPGAAAVSWNFTISSISVLGLVLVATALVVVGSITLLRRYLIGGLVLSALAPVVYAVAINYVTMNYCLSPLLCFWTSRKRVGLRNPKAWRCLGIPERVLHLLSSCAGLGRGTHVEFPTFWEPSNNCGDEESLVHRKRGGIVSQVWVEPAVPVKVLSQLWPSPEPHLALCNIL